MGNFADMRSQYKNMVHYVEMLIREKLVPMLCIQKLRILLAKLEIEGYTHRRPIPPFINIEELIAKLFSEQKCSFRVDGPSDCKKVKYCKDQ